MNPETKSGTLFIGHRGASYDAPENTMAAINLAWDTGADAVEIDIQLSKDNIIVVFHDDETSRYNGIKKAIAEYTFAELQNIDVGSFKGQQWSGQLIPTLNEILESLPAGKTLVIELKSGADVITGLQALINKKTFLLPQIIFISFHRQAISKIKKIYPQNIALRIYEPEYHPSAQKWLPDADQMLEEVKEDNLDGLDVSICPIVDRDFIERLNREKLRLAVWTINDEKDAGIYFDNNIFGITTDRPVWLRDKMIK